MGFSSLLVFYGFLSKKLWNKWESLRTRKSLREEEDLWCGSERKTRWMTLVSSTARMDVYTTLGKLEDWRPERIHLIPRCQDIPDRAVGRPLVLVSYAIWMLLPAQQTSRVKEGRKVDEYGQRLYFLFAQMRKSISLFLCFVQVFAIFLLLERETSARCITRQKSCGRGGNETNGVEKVKKYRQSGEVWKKVLQGRW